LTDRNFPCRDTTEAAPQTKVVAFLRILLMRNAQFSLFFLADLPLNHDVRDSADFSNSL